MLGSNPVVSTKDRDTDQLLERNLLANNPMASANIISYLRGYDYELKSESGAEYGYYIARPKQRTAIVDDGKVEIHASPSSLSHDGVGGFDVELISPANPHQVMREMPPLGHVLVRETPDLYRNVVKPYIQSIIDSQSLKWITNVIDGTKERERLLFDHDEFIINIDTKWRTHPPPLTTSRCQWHGHASTTDLYCLGITKLHNLWSLRDLRRVHVPMLLAMERSGLEVIHSIYGIHENQVRVYVHYHPQFYHFHMHFTRLENEVGCTVGHSHLINDIVQNLLLEDEYYSMHTITYKLPGGTTLWSLMGG